MPRARRTVNETDGVARVILRLNNTRSADGSRPKNPVAEARALWRKENGISTVNSKGKKKITTAEVSISSAMQRLGKIKSDMYVTSKAMSMTASGLINEGMNAYNKHSKASVSSSSARSSASSKSSLSISSISPGLEKSYADHLLGLEYYTDLCLGKTQPDIDGEKEQMWQFKSGKFENLKEEDIYMPRKESETWDGHDDSTESNLAFKCAEIDVKNALQKLRVFKGDLKSDFRYMSILLQKFPMESCETPVKKFILGVLIEPVKGHYTPAQDIYAATTNEILSAIKSILTDGCGFKFHAVTVRDFKTRQYTINLCEINGWLEFEIESTMFRVELCRKMVIVNMIETSSPNYKKYVPICEELFIQISKKYGNTETYHRRGLYLTCKPKPPLTTKDSYYSQQMHYFGNNAFTVNISPCHTEPFDKNRDTMKMVGVVVRLLQGVGSSDTNIAHQTYEFFKKILDTKKPGKTDHSSSSSVTDEDCISNLRKSFLANQHANDQTAVVEGKHPSIRIWMSSKSFSIVCVSPAKYPALNYVYVYLWESEIVGTVTSNPIYPLRAQSESTFSNDTPSTLQPADSTLPLELELELALL